MSIIQVLFTIGGLAVLAIIALYFHELRTMNRLQGDHINKLNEQLRECFDKIDSLKIQNNFKDRCIKKLRLQIGEQK